MKEYPSIERNELSDEELRKVNGGQSDGEQAIKVVDNALQRALNQKNLIGNEENRLECTSSNLTNASENLQNAETIYQDSDMK